MIIEGLDDKETCPNDHPVHGSCLMEWLIKSNTCPLCSEPYAPEVLSVSYTHLTLPTILLV